MITNNASVPLLHPVMKEANQSFNIIRVVQQEAAFDEVGLVDTPSSPEQRAKVLERWHRTYCINRAALIGKTQGVYRHLET